MPSLLIGLVAALCWGLHDICVRFVTTRAGVGLSLAIVLGAGLVAVLPVAWVFGDWRVMSAGLTLTAIASGLAYAVGAYCLYHAFDIGPIKLVAPVIGAYPVLSVAWAAAQGNPPSPTDMAAVLCIVAGVGLIAALAKQDGGAAQRGRGALFWATGAAFGFALTFAIGQTASHGGAELPVIAISRGVAFVAVAALVGARTLPRDMKGLPWRLLVLMGLLDALALGLVLAAGGLARPEFAAVASSTFGMISVLLAFAFLKEPMTPPQWLSVALVFAGVGYLAL